MVNDIPFYKYSYEFWNSCYDLLEPETQCYANEGDFVFLCDGVLFLLSDPYGVANLVVQRIAPSIHPTPVIKHIYELILWLSDLSVPYLQFYGEKNRYSTLFRRLFSSAVLLDEPWVLPLPSESDESRYVIKICPACVDFSREHLYSTTYTRIIPS